MSILNRIIPILFAAMIIIVMVFGFVLIAYLILIGLFIGLIMMFVNTIRARLFPPKPKKPAPSSSGRIIDTDEWRKL